MAQAGPESGCYVYRPKRDREKLNDAGSDADSDADVSNNGITASRLAAFVKTWEPTRRVLDDVLESADAGSVDQICKWLSNQFPRTLDRIPTGLITTSTASSLLTKVSTHAEEGVLVISVPASQCNNLKSVLKCIVSAVSADVVSETRLLNYDLEILQNYINTKGYEKVLLYFGNGESLHGGVLSDLVDVLDSWRDRIPFIFIFETAVSIELFQEKLTRRALGMLRGEPFSTASAGDVVEGIFRKMATGREQQLWMGASPASLLADRQAEHLQSAQAFVSAIKYMYMTHFYGNPLSVLLDSASTTWTKELIEAATKAKSFQNYVSELKEQKKGKEATKLLKDEKAFAQLVSSSIKHGQSRLSGISDAVQVLGSIHEAVPGKTGLIWSRLYVLAFSGQLLGSPVLRNLMLSVRAMASDGMKTLLERLAELGVPEAPSLQAELSELISSHTQNGPLRSEHDQSHETMRTTVVAKKISLTKQKSALSKGDAEYSSLVKSVSSCLDDYLKQRLISPRTLLFNEIFILRVPQREAFSPRPRHALEHALTIPGAYLNCKCCDHKERSLSGAQPATSILYQLYLESGTMVSIADLWAAFEAVMSSRPCGEDGMNQDGGMDEQAL